VLDRPLKKIVEKAKLPRISVHSFRRTYENLLRQAGVDDLVRRTLAGWRREGTQAIYAGVAPEERAIAARKLVALVPAQVHPTGTPERSEGS
jgi:integrase